MTLRIAIPFYDGYLVAQSAAPTHEAFVDGALLDLAPPSYPRADAEADWWDGTWEWVLDLRHGVAA